MRLELVHGPLKGEGSLLGGLDHGGGGGAGGDAAVAIGVLVALLDGDAVEAAAGGRLNTPVKRALSLRAGSITRLSSQARTSLPSLSLPVTRVSYALGLKLTGFSDRPSDSQCAHLLAGCSG